jgi:acetoin utilization protein AcuB
MTRVSDVMSRDVATIAAGASCREAVDRMVRRKVRHLPVVEGDGRLVGIVTDRDLRHSLFAPALFTDTGGVSVDALFGAVSVKDVMSAPVVTATPEQALEDAARLMVEDKIGSLPVVAEGRVIGILTETDLLRRLCAREGCSEDVEVIVVSYP